MTPFFPPNNRLTARPRYKRHRMVDDRCGVITAVATTPAEVTQTALLLAQPKPTPKKK